TKASKGLLVQRRRLYDLATQGMVWRRRDRRKRLRISIHATLNRCSRYVSNVDAHVRQGRRWLLRVGTEPCGRFCQRAHATIGDVESEMDGRSRLPAH